ncbi:MAG: peptidoglycan DD-metalloendopeptidase family protein [Campylobacterales bacterium]|nr:peptidoglycan DD-metalloendopeptidase family protein [Campylobacterales bacterium]
MNSHFTITIHDDNGLKQVNVHKFVKKVLLYFVLFLLFVGVIGVATILYLDKQVSDIEKNKQEVEKAFSELKNKNTSLNKEVEKTYSLLIAKKKELQEVSESLSEIETLIGLEESVKDKSLLERVDIAKLDSEHKVALLQFIPNGSPIVNKGITSSFGYRIHPTLNRKEFHKGIDMRAPMDTPVYATADGLVEWAGFHKSSGFGNLVILNHNYGFRTNYGHLNKVVVKSGQFVKKGTLIAYTGNSGMSSGPHLHYEIKFIHQAVNPIYFVEWSIKNYNDIFKKEDNIPWQSLVRATAQIKVQEPTQTLPSSQRVALSKGR